MHSASARAGRCMSSYDCSSFWIEPLFTHLPYPWIFCGRPTIETGVSCVFAKRAQLDVG